jgi:hypothetical protein
MMMASQDELFRSESDERSLRALAAWSKRSLRIDWSSHERSPRLFARCPFQARTMQNPNSFPSDLNDSSLFQLTQGGRG